MNKTNRSMFLFLPAHLLALVVLTACNNQSSDSNQVEFIEAVETGTEVADKKLSLSDTMSAINLSMVVHKTPNCGCCQKWVDYLEEEGFTVEVHNHNDVNPIKQSLGMNDPDLYSCHTAIIDDYIIEGHVPASDIRKLLATKPDIAGLTAPGMPMLSPGMNSRTPKDYDVLSFTLNGETALFSQY